MIRSTDGALKTGVTVTGMQGKGLCKEWIVLQIVCKTEWNSWAETFEQWTSQICSDKFCDFWQTRDTKNLKRGWDWDFAEHYHSNCYTSLCSKFCLISCLLGWIDLGLLQWGQATKLLGHSSHASGLVCIKKKEKSNTMCTHLVKQYAYRKMFKRDWSRTPSCISNQGIYA